MAQREWVEKDFYKELGVSSDASADEIKRAAPQAAGRDPSRPQPEQPAAEERYKAVGEAKDVLSDETKRKEYDETRRLFARRWFRSPVQWRRLRRQLRRIRRRRRRIQPRRPVRRGPADRRREHRRPVRWAVRSRRTAAAADPAAPRQRPGDRDGAVVPRGHQGRRHAAAAHQPGAVHELPWQRRASGHQPQGLPELQRRGCRSTATRARSGSPSRAPNAGAAARSSRSRARSATAPA